MTQVITSTQQLHLLRTDTVLILLDMIACEWTNEHC